MKDMSHIVEALSVLKMLGMPRTQQNDRTALCLLALINLPRKTSWKSAKSRLIGITPMMEFAAEQYGRKYAPNSRETFRRFSMHQLVQAGIALYNPDAPARPTNSPNAVYQIAPAALVLLKTFGSRSWSGQLTKYLKVNSSLTKRYAKERDMAHVPVKLAAGRRIRLSPGSHNELIKAIVEQFVPRFIPNGVLIYVGDTGDKWGYFDAPGLSKLGVMVDEHGKMPDVVVYHKSKKWMVLIESVTSHGPMDSKRHQELAALFSASKAGLVYVTAFPTRSIMTRYLADLAWETEVWVADSPTHMIHFNGSRFLGPH